MAVILAYMRYPFVTGLQRFVKSRIAAFLLGLVIVLSIVVGSFAVIIPMMAREIQTASQMINRVISEQDLQQKIAAYMPEKISDDLNRFLENRNWQELFNSQEIKEYGKLLWEKIAPHIGSIFSGTLSVLFWLVSLFIVLLYLVFLLKDYNRVLDEWRDLIPPKYRKRVIEFLRNS